MVTKDKTKASRKPEKVNKLCRAEYYDMQDAFDALFAKSENGEIFSQVMEVILSRDNLLLAYRNIKKKDTPGTDGLTIRDVERYPPQIGSSTCRIHCCTSLSHGQQAVCAEIYTGRSKGDS